MHKPLHRILPWSLAAALLAPAHSLLARDQEIPLAPGWGDLDYHLPVPGSYQLPPITTASDGAVIDHRGTSSRLFDLMGDRVVLFSFIYTKCDDLNGCPLSNAVFHKLQAKLQARPEVAERTRLLSMSFDPERDTPEVMRKFGEGLGGNGVDWRFLTTRDRDTLQPILDDYGQFVMREYDESGEYTGDFAHTLRVYLIDRDLQIRNIYSVSFLHADLLIRDVETLLMESPAG